MRAELRRGAAAAAGALLLAVCIVWGQWLARHGTRLALPAPPFQGRWDWRPGGATLAAVVAGAVLVVAGPRVAQALEWGRLLVVTVLTGAGWAVCLALTDGVRGGLERPVLDPGQYLHEVPRVHDVTGFLSTYTRYVITHGGPHPWNTEAAGHPPGMLLVLAGLREIGLGGAWPVVVLCIGGGVLASAAVLVACRELVDEATARAAAPFLALLPAVLWLAVSGDAFFLGVSAWGVTLLVLGASRGSDGWALSGGLVLGCALFLTYGMLPLGVALVVAMLVARRLRALAVAGVGVVAVVAVFAALGFWWPDGLHQTLLRYRAGAGGYRPYGYFVVADLALLAAAVGPAVLAGIGSLVRGDRLWRLVGPALLAVAVADLSGASKSEVERIWLPFMPWLALAAARLPHPRVWLGLQVATAVVLQTWLVSLW